MCICHVLSNKGQWLDITLMYGWIKVPPWQTEFKFTCWEVHHFLIKNIKCVNRHYISNLHNNPSLADFRDIEIHSFCSNSYTATSGFQLLHKVHFIEFWLIFSKSVRIEKRFRTVLPFQGIQQLNHLLICFQTYFVWIYQNSYCCRNLVISTSFGLMCWWLRNRFSFFCPRIPPHGVQPLWTKWSGNLTNTNLDHNNRKKKFY